MGQAERESLARCAAFCYTYESMAVTWDMGEDGLEFEDGEDDWDDDYSGDDYPGDEAFEDYYGLY